MTGAILRPVSPRLRSNPSAFVAIANAPAAAQIETPKNFRHVRNFVCLDFSSVQKWCALAVQGCTSDNVTPDLPRRVRYRQRLRGLPGDLFVSLFVS